MRRTPLLATAGLVLALCACSDNNDNAPPLKKSTATTPPPATKPAPMTTKPTTPAPAPTTPAKPPSTTTEPVKTTPAPGSTPPQSTTPTSKTTTPSPTTPATGTTEPLSSQPKSTTPGAAISVTPTGVNATTRTAIARLSPTSGNQAAGTVSFSANTSGMGVTVQVSMTGLTPGEHGMHIHEKGDCSAPDAASAGDHYSATPNPHGGPHDTARHTGDLGNIVADAQGHVETSFTDERLSLSGPDSILNRAVIVHAGKDDFITQPSGDSGARVACGIIEGLQTPETTPSEPPKSETPR